MKPVAEFLESSSLLTFFVLATISAAYGERHSNRAMWISEEWTYLWPVQAWVEKLDQLKLDLFISAATSNDCRCGHACCGRLCKCFSHVHRFSLFFIIKLVFFVRQTKPIVWAHAGCMCTWSRTLLCFCICRWYNSKSLWIKFLIRFHVFSKLLKLEELV